MTVPNETTAAGKGYFCPIRAMLGMVDTAFGMAADAVHALERSIVYHPSNGRVPPDTLLPGAVTETLETADGERVLVWGVPPAEGRPVVLYYHGNGETVYSRPTRFKALVKAGIGVLALSYRGYASSTGRPSEDGLHRDAEALYHAVRARHPGSPVALWGYSLGSAVAVRLAAEHPVAKVVLEAPFTSILDVGAGWYLPIVRSVMREQFRSDQRIARISAPTLFMTGGRDTWVPARLGERLFALANEPKQLTHFELADHFDMDRHGAVRKAIEFIDAA
jgi:alpha-beta hydrolase superfamily lysophospholipase